MTRPRRAVLVVVDGLRADLVGGALTPAIGALAARSRRFVRHRAVFPSATRVNSASIATGCYPARHGLAGNAIALDEGDGLRPVSVGGPEFRERWRRATGRTLHRPTLAERLRAHGGVRTYANASAGAAHMQDPDGHGWLFHRSGSYGPGLEPVAADLALAVSHDGAGDAAATARFCADLAAEPGGAALWTLWLCEPDHSQHTLELGSPEHRAVLAGADACVAAVADTVEARRAAGDDVLLVVCSDHGHETVDAIVPVAERLVAAGLKEAADSSDVVLASSGMGALVYLAEPDARRRERRTAVLADWLRAQPWTDRVAAGPELRALGQRAAGGLAIAIAMAKRDAPNRFGIPGLGAVAADPFMTSDALGHGQHGGLGRYETHPLLAVSGGGFVPGPVRTPTAAVDIAPTVAGFLGIPAAGMDGRPLAPR